MTPRPQNPPFTRGNLYRGRWPFDQHKGEAHPASKLTDEQVAEIQRRKAGGESAKLIAAEFGITDIYVHKLCRAGRRPTPKPRTTN